MTDCKRVICKITYNVLLGILKPTHVPYPKPGVLSDKIDQFNKHHKQ